MHAWLVPVLLNLGMGGSAAAEVVISPDHRYGTGLGAAARAGTGLGAAARSGAGRDGGSATGTGRAPN